MARFMCGPEHDVWRVCLSGLNRIDTPSAFARYGMLTITMVKVRLFVGGVVFVVLFS